MGGKKETLNASSDFCTSKNVSAFELNLDLFSIKRALFSLLLQKTCTFSRMLKSLVLGPWVSHGTALCLSSWAWM